MKTFIYQILIIIVVLAAIVGIRSAGILEIGDVTYTQKTPPSEKPSAPTSSVSIHPEEISLPKKTPASASSQKKKSSKTPGTKANKGKNYKEIQSSMEKTENPKPTITKEELEKQLKGTKKKLADLLTQIEKEKNGTSASDEVASSTSFSKINTETRKALVNILCESKGEVYKSVSGSGVIIDPAGIILTNAHIGQFFIVKNYPSEGYINCYIRKGSPAEKRYKAKLIYLSQKWINKNSDLIDAKNPKGTGENDYALLEITKTTNNSKPPEEFPYISPAETTSQIKTGQKMLIAGYPAGLLREITIREDLNIVSTIDEIEKFYTFGENKLDLLSFGGNPVAQKGASGSAVVNQNKKLVGTVVTSSMAEQTSERDMRAITIDHINRSLKQETNLTLTDLLKAGKIQELKEKFRAEILPLMKNILVNSLQK